VPVAIPQPVWRIEAAPGLPFGAYAYPKLPGRPWTRDEAAAGRGAVARQIAGFLHGVHAYPVDRAVDAGIPSFDEFWADIVSLRSSTDNAVKQHLPAFEYARVKEWWDAFLSDSLLQEAPRRLVHGDLWRHNLLVDETAENLTGVLDFGDLAIVDVSYDFVFFLEPGGDLLESCRAAYEGLGGGLDPGFEHRFNRWWELRSGSWFSIRAAVRTGDQAVLEDSLQELRTSQIFRSPDSISGKM
jgi:aminoglycoside phosphotransferase (APT) family kinase protein